MASSAANWQFRPLRRCKIEPTRGRPQGFIRPTEAQAYQEGTK
jgi:hypothetical protein